MPVLFKKIASIIDDLRQEGNLTPAQLHTVDEAIKSPNNKLDKLLIEQGILGEPELYKRLAKKANIPILRLSQYQPELNAIRLLDYNQASKWRIIPLFKIEEKITIATDNPFNLSVLDEARQDLNCEISCVLASRTEIDAAIKQYYGALQKDPEQAFSSTQKEDRASSSHDEDDVRSTVKTLDNLLHQAFIDHASDLHIEPTREGLAIRVRIDGVLENLTSLPQSLHHPIISRIKILAGMDIAEHRIPQSGRMRVNFDSIALDMRVATYPTILGEAAAIRLLSQENLISLHDLGLREEDRKLLEQLIHKPHGVFLVTGPTGSGKTTTLYAILQEIDSIKNHILSVEDPVENEIAGIKQTQINPKAGVTFPEVLRAMLRQDPDVVMVGEIRDQETADVSLRAALTGHLVLSTLHTNNSISAIARLKDLGIDEYLISASLVGVMAQRLVRRICDDCKEEYGIPPETAQKLGPKAQGMTTAFHGRGCHHCRMRGYRGRIGIFELLAIQDNMRAIMGGISFEQLVKEKALATGFRTLLEDGIEKIKQGITTPEEVLRVCGEL